MDGKDVKRLLRKENIMQWPVAMDYMTALMDENGWDRTI